MPVCAPACMEAESLVALTAGTGRGFTVLCAIPNPTLLQALGDAAGATGLVVAVGRILPAGGSWRAVRCDTTAAIPLRSHIVDAAIMLVEAELEAVAAEVRRVLAPGGDVRVLLGGADREVIEAALAPARIRPRGVSSGILIARGP